WFDVDLGDAELASELRQLIQIDRADNVDDGQFLRLGGNHHQAGDLPLVHLEEDVDVIAVLLAAHRHHLRPDRGAHLRPQRLDVDIGVFARVGELERPDVDAFQFANQI